jgi:hypothetical protein
MELINRFLPYVELLKKGNFKENLNYYSTVGKILKYIYSERDINGFGSISIENDIIIITSNGKKETLRISKTKNFQWSFIAHDIFKFSTDVDKNVKDHFLLRKDLWQSLTKHKFNNINEVSTKLLNFWYEFFKTITDSTNIWLNILNEKTNFLVIEKTNGYQILNLSDLIVKQNFDIHLMDNCIMFIFEKGAMLRFSIDIEKGIKPNIGYIFHLVTQEVLDPIAIIPN